MEHSTHTHTDQQVVMRWRRYNILGTLLRPSRGSSATGGSTEEAMHAYQTALILAPTFVDATLNLAGLLVEDEQFDYALRVVRMARSVLLSVVLDWGRLRVFV